MEVGLQEESLIPTLGLTVSLTFVSVTVKCVTVISVLWDTHCLCVASLLPPYHIDRPSFLSSDIRRDGRSVGQPILLLQKAHLEAA